MSLDFQQVSQQVRQMGEKAGERQKSVEELRAKARALLDLYANAHAELRQRVAKVVQHHDPNLRCAIPIDPAVAAPEALNAHFAALENPAPVTVIAADGSQIPYDRHADVEYCLINVGSIQMAQSGGAAPQTTVFSQLLYDEQIMSGSGMITEAGLALLRDKLERTLQASLAEDAPPPVVTFTDGPMELWGAHNTESEGAGYQKHLQEYLLALRRLHDCGAIAAGYVDKPSADLVVRLLEVMQTAEIELSQIKTLHSLRRVRDFDLFRLLLQPGERSAVFAIQSPSAAQYTEELALHFFYLNVGRPGHSWVARVEIPAWIATDCNKLDLLHAVIVRQCQITGARPYPYLLHRAHETAVVSLEERDQVTQMIAQELRRRGVEPGEKSYKQTLKEAQGRTGYKR